MLLLQRACRSLVTRNYVEICLQTNRKILTIAPYRQLKSQINYRCLASFASEHKYSKKTTKQIQNEIAMQKWKQMQNTFKSLNSRFGLTKPSAADLQNPKYPKPSKIEYNLENLREYSHSYPVYLYWELQKEGSPMNQVISKVIDNLWKAEQKQTMEFLQFLYSWQYNKVDLINLHEVVISKFDISMGQLFKFLKRFQGKLSSVIELKVLQRLDKENLSSNQYGDLLKIVNYFTIKNLLSDQFYLATTNLVSNNINKIPPGEALQAFVYFTYNINEHVNLIRKQETADQKGENSDLGVDILKIIEKRILSPQCLKFYNGEQLVALLHTFLKNNLILADESKTEEYQSNLQKIVNRIELGYYAEDFSTKNKQSLLEISALLPQIKKQTIIALVQHELFKKKEKFDFNLFPDLYLISYENNMLTQELQSKIQQGIIENIFQLEKKNISRVLWLLTLTGAKNLNSMHKKIQTIIEGGLNGFKIQDVCIIVWSMSAHDFNPEAKFWQNIQSYLYQELQRQARKSAPQTKSMNSSSQPKQELQQGQKKQQVRLVNECSWILWAYHNNRPLGMQLLNLISSIIIGQYEAEINDDEKLMKAFELTNIISFYYSVEFPSQAIVDLIKKICMSQFVKTYSTMEPIQLCKCLKYIGSEVWRNQKLADGILDIFELEAEKIPYRDIITVVGILISSEIKNKRVTALIVKLMERKKRLESLQNIGTQPIDPDKKQSKSKWRFTI